MDRASLDAGWWTIPAENTKNGQSHRVPLAEDVIALIRAQKPDEQDEGSEYVFAGLDGAAVLHRAKKAPAAIARVLGIDFRGHDCDEQRQLLWRLPAYLASTLVVC